MVQGEQIALHYIDLDHFKRVNDTLGHPVGDALLQQAAQRLRGCVRASDFVARLGGDEFAVLQTGVHSLEDAVGLARRVISAFDLSADSTDGKSLQAPAWSAPPPSMPVARDDLFATPIPASTAPSRKGEESSAFSSR